VSSTWVGEEPAVAAGDAARRYVDDTVRVWIGASDRSIPLPRLPDHLARLLLRLEEYERSERDRWGIWDYASSENVRAGRLWEPEIDAWLAAARAALEPTTALEPMWPDGHRFAVCLTHDVDLLSAQSTVGQVVRFARAGLAPGAVESAERLRKLARPAVRVVRSARSGIARFPSTAETIDRSVAAEAKRGVAASYLFTAPPHGRGSRYDCVYVPRDRCTFRGARASAAQMMRDLAAEGFDVGLHGSYAGALEPGALAAERAVLQSRTGLELTTTRQHFLRWDIRTTPALQEAAGLGVDSTLGYNRNVGFRAGTSLPFHHFDVAAEKRLALLEIPLAIEDTALLSPGGLELDFPEARAVVGHLLDRVADVGGVGTLLFHPDKFADHEWLALYEWSLDRALDEGAWVTSLRGLADWWREREQRVVGG
jgi:hypothetical protein